MGDVTASGKPGGVVLPPEMTAKATLDDVKERLESIFSKPTGITQEELNALGTEGKVLVPGKNSLPFQGNPEVYSAVLNSCASWLQSHSKEGRGNDTKILRLLLLKLLKNYPQMADEPEVQTALKTAQSALEATREDLAGRVSKETAGRASTEGDIVELVGSKRLEDIRVGKPLQGEIPERLKAVYSVANGAALLNCDFSQSQPRGVITLRIGGEESKHYIKLRDLAIRKDVPEDKANWISVGNPVKFYISKTDFDAQVALHDNVERFGPFGEIETAAQAFQGSAESQIQELASQSDQDVLARRKLTTGMDPKGRFRVIEKEALGKGSLKKIDKGTILTEQGRSPIAMAKLHSSKEDSLRVQITRREAEISQMLRDAKVPHVLDIQVTPGQNLKKVRLEMPLLENTELLDLIKRGEIQEMDQETKIKYMSQLAEALAGLHRNGWTHNDIKSVNVLFDKEKGEVFLIDFGAASKFEDAARPLAGTYPAPEAASVEKGVSLHIDKSKAEKNDCWAFGLVLYETMHGSKDPGVPWKIDAEACWEKGRASICAFAQEVREKLGQSEDPVDILIVALLLEDPAGRPSMEKVVEILCSQEPKRTELIKPIQTRIKKIQEETRLQQEETERKEKEHVRETLKKIGDTGKPDFWKRYRLSDETIVSLYDSLEATTLPQNELIPVILHNPSDYLNVAWDLKIDPKEEIRGVWGNIIEQSFSQTRAGQLRYVFKMKSKLFIEKTFSSPSYKDWVERAILLLSQGVPLGWGDRKVELSDDEQKNMVTLVAHVTAQILIPEMENKLGKESAETQALERLPPERKRALAWVTAELMGKGGDPQTDTTESFKRFAPPDPTEEERGIVSKFLTKLR